MESPPDINRNISGADPRAARKAAKISQADLAKRIGVCRDTARFWEAKANHVCHTRADAGTLA